MTGARPADFSEGEINNGTKLLAPDHSAHSAWLSGETQHNETDL
jgi:hypothetical protein